MNRRTIMTKACRRVALIAASSLIGLLSGVPSALAQSSEAQSIRFNVTPIPLSFVIK